MWQVTSPPPILAMTLFATFPESPLQTAERHVRQAEAQVRRQLRALAGLRAAGGPTADAEQMLHSFQEHLCGHRRQMADLAAHAHARRMADAPRA